VCEYTESSKVKDYEVYKPSSPYFKKPPIILPHTNEFGLFLKLWVFSGVLFGYTNNFWAFLSTYYSTDASLAFSSVEHIMRDVNLD
jgi:quinol-cytochrome oxidoreductase complex cytochrome b subunit